jgi:ubiquinone/menaquinone biosynthesis C-methylase UbiE
LCHTKISVPFDKEQNNLTDRIASEKAFHNKLFASGSRKPLDRYYSVFEAISNDFRDKLTESTEGSSLLEIGSGVNAAPAELVARAQQITGIDISEEAIRQAKEKAADRELENCRYLVMNAEVLAFGDATFDKVYGYAILHHLDLSRAIPEICRVLKPEGRLLFREPLGHNPVLNLYRRFTPGMRTPDEHPLLRKDLKMIAGHFKEVHYHYYYLTALLAVPLRKTSLFKPVLSALLATDSFLFRLIPPVRYLAWYVIIDARSPVK